ncbi:unnamed protein product [Malus baccata var. baccata]
MHRKEEELTLVFCTNLSSACFSRVSSASTLNLHKFSGSQEHSGLRSCRFSWIFQALFQSRSIDFRTPHSFWHNILQPATATAKPPETEENISSTLTEHTDSVR